MSLGMFSKYKGVIVTALLAIFLLTSPAHAAKTLEKMRIGQTDERTRIVFDLTHQSDDRISILSNPSRVVVDFPSFYSALDFKKFVLQQDSRLYRVRVLRLNNGAARIVLDLHKNQDVKYFKLPPSRTKPHRLVVDLLDPEEVAQPDKEVRMPMAKAEPTSPPVAPAKPQNVAQSAPAKVAEEEPVADTQFEAKPSAKSDAQTKTLAMDYKPKNYYIVAIDPGHGGYDSGAVGHDGIYEKEVTLQLAKRLAKAINVYPNMQAFLTRMDDRYLGLEERVEIAKRKQADLFISVHADSFHDSSVKGGAVYVLNEKGASSEMARLLADSENGYLKQVNLQKLDKDVAYAISDLSRAANAKSSRDLAQSVLSQMKKSVELHNENVQSANFAVLRLMDMPAILVEGAFLSNPQEAKKLTEYAFQTKLAHSIAEGIGNYVNDNQGKPLWGDNVMFQYVVKSGDNLTMIAQRFNVSVKDLVRINQLRSKNVLRVGAKIKIPITPKFVRKEGIFNLSRS